MATKKEDASALQTQDDRVEVFLRHNDEEPDKIIGVNGVMYQIPRGKPTMVPRFVADELRRAELAEIHQFEEQRRLQELSKQPDAR